jgi:hypothetical protein
LKSRIRELEEQLENVCGASTNNDTSKPLPSYDHPTLPFAVPGVFPTASSEPASDRLGPSFSDMTFVGNHTSNPLLGSDTGADSGFNPIPQTSIVSHLDSISQAPVEVQSIDLEWLMTDSRASKPVLGRTQVHSPPMEREHKNPDHSQIPSNTSLPRHLGSLDRARVGGNSGQSAHKMTTAPIAQNPGHETPIRPDATRLERLSLLMEYSRCLGFNNLNEALSVYYTSDLSKSAILSHEQSLDRVRQLPNFLSNVREHSRYWQTWERDNYVRETLRSAEEIYAEECRLARTNLQDQGITGLPQKGFQADQIVQITRDLQQEVCFASITSLLQQILTYHD